MIIVTGMTRNWYSYVLVNTYSLLESNKVEKIYFIIEDDEYKPLRDMCNKYKTKCEFINIANMKYIKETSPNYKTHYSLLSMVRLYLHKIIKEDKVMWIDADALVVGDITDLWNEDVKYIMGIKEGGNWEDHLGVSNIEYINSGILVINLKNSSVVFDRCLEMINEKKYAFPDQDVINLAFYEKKQFASNMYNSCLTTGISNNPKIIHYIRENKGWTSNTTVWYNELNHMLKEIGGFMIKVKVKENIGSLRAYKECLDKSKNVLRSGEIVKGSIIYVNEKMYNYLNGDNDYKRSFVELIEIEADEPVVEKKEETTQEISAIAISEGTIVADVHTIGKDIKDMNFFELKAYAKAQGLKLGKKITKKELLKLLNVE